MTIIADFLRDNQDTTWKIYPSPQGELILTQDVPPDDAWSDVEYTVNDTGQVTYQTLADSNGTTWYLYPLSTGEFILTQTLPAVVAGGVWYDFIYGAADILTPDEAATGDEVYLSLADVNSIPWYVYPNDQGELVISTVEPD